jgi:hypothetical protein
MVRLGSWLNTDELYDFKGQAGAETNFRLRFQPLNKLVHGSALGFWRDLAPRLLLDDKSKMTGFAGVGGLGGG